jgi:hypothetical protein
MKKLKKAPVQFAYHDESSGLLKQMSSDTRGEKGVGETLNELITAAMNDTVSESESLASLARSVVTTNVISEVNADGTAIQQPEPIMSVKNPKLSMELLTTPKSLGYITSEELVGGGFFYRCLLCTPEPILLTESDELAWNNGTTNRMTQIIELADRFSRLPNCLWYMTIQDDVMIEILHGLTIGDDDDELEAYRTHLKLMTVKCAAIKCVDRLIDDNIMPRSGESFDVSSDDVNWALSNIIRPAMHAFINLFKNVTNNNDYTRIVRYISTSTESIIKVRGQGKSIKNSLKLPTEIFDKYIDDAVELTGTRFVTIPNTNNVPVKYICKDDDCQRCNYHQQCDYCNRTRTEIE